MELNPSVLSKLKKGLRISREVSKAQRHPYCISSSAHKKNLSGIRSIGTGEVENKALELVGKFQKHKGIHTASVSFPT